MTKYYYNNELIRTSKNHSNYTHAVIQEKNDGTIEVLACCSSEELATKQLKSMYNYYYVRTIANLNAKINAMENGRKHYYFKEGKRQVLAKIRETDNIDDAKAILEEDMRYAKRFEESTSIVELEAR